MNPSQYFRNDQYLLEDSAFQASPTMVSAFKRPPKTELDLHKTYFNTKLAKARIKTEHCLDLLKTRFQYFKEVRVVIKSKAHMKNVIKYLTSGCIIHNLLISEPVPSEWEYEIHQNGLEIDNELNAPVPRDASGEERRKQLCCYLLEIVASGKRKLLSCYGIPSSCSFFRSRKRLTFLESKTLELLRLALSFLQLLLWLVLWLPQFAL